MSDPWEQLRHLTLDQLVTKTKLSGSALVLYGFTTPEGWPFTVAVAVGAPGNDRAVAMLQEYQQRMHAAAQWTRAAANPKGGTP